MNRRNATKTLGVHYKTLYTMATRGEIESVKIGKQQMYNVDKYLHDKKNINDDENINEDSNDDIIDNNELDNEEPNNKRNICYCRVSSTKQRAELKREILEMEIMYPDYEIISDIGSGTNFNRPGLKKIIDYAIKGEIEIVVIAYKDILAGIGYELVENIIKEYSKGVIEVMKKENSEEITKELLSVVNIYVEKINGINKK